MVAPPRQRRAGRSIRMGRCYHRGRGCQGAARPGGRCPQRRAGV